MQRTLLLLAAGLLTTPATADDVAAKFAGEWLTTMGPLKLAADGEKLAGGLTFWNLAVSGEVKDGKVALGYDEGKVHVDATLTPDPSGRSFLGPFRSSNGNRGQWKGWRFDPAAEQGPPADFAGLWLTDMGLMELARDGSKFRGRYALRGTSTIEGEAKGRHLDARIRASRPGPARFDLDEAGTSLFGAGGTDGMAPWYGWNGRKAARFARHAPLEAGQVVDGSTAGLLTYSARAPEGYQPGDGRKWPAVVILHGSNLNGRAYVATIAAAWPDVARDYILLGINGELPSRIDPDDPAFNYTYVNFMGRSTYKGFPGTDRESPALVREAMDDLKTAYPIQRYFVGGHSQGGYLAYTLLMHSPEALAGVFPVSAEVMIQNEPAVFADEPTRAAQRAVPLAIVHGRTDPMIRFTSATYGHGLFLDAGWPAVRLFDSADAGHMFARLPVGPAIRWLETLASDDPARLLAFAEARLKDDAPRDVTAAIRRARTLPLDAGAKDRLDALDRQVDAQAGPRAAEFLPKIEAAQDFGWVDDFLAFRERYEFAGAAAPAMKAFDALRARQDEPARKLMGEARGLFNQGKRPEGYARYQEVVDKYPASTSYRLAKSWLAERR